MRPPDGRGVGAPGISGKIIGVAISTRAQEDGIRLVGLQLSVDQIPRDNPLGSSLVNHQIQHLVPRKHPHPPQSNLAAQRLVGSQ